MLGAAGLDGERAVTADPDLPPFGTPSPLETQLPLPEGTASPATALKVAQGSAAGGRYTGADLEVSGFARRIRGEFLGSGQ